MHNYKAYRTIKLGKNSTERDLYELFGDQIAVSIEGEVVKDYWKKYKK